MENSPSYSGCRSCLTLFAISGLRPQTTIGIGDIMFVGDPKVNQKLSELALTDSVDCM